MKFAFCDFSPAQARSLPVRGAWIEILHYVNNWCYIASLPVRGAWIEIHLFNKSSQSDFASLPVRGAWIEIETVDSNGELKPVAPRAGSVD